MKQAIPYIVIALLLIFIGWQCHSDSKVQPSTKPEKDTVVKDYSDVVAKIAADQKRSSDSVKMLLGVINNIQDDADGRELDLKNRVAEADFTIARMRTAKEGHDTAGYINACDTLGKQYESGKIAVLLYKHERDSLLKLWPDVHHKDSLTNVSLLADTHLKDFLFNKLSLDYDTAETERVHYQKLASKRFSVGPSIGFAFSGSFKPYVGIGVHYSLIKF